MAAPPSSTPGTGTIFTAGNAGNGSNPEPQGVVDGAGSQILSASTQPESAQNPGAPTPMGNFNILQLPANTKADKSAKDNNFCGLTINNNVVYFTKGSGSRGINTVYFLDSTVRSVRGALGQGRWESLQHAHIGGCQTRASTVSGSGDEGADPNALVAPTNQQVIRGVSFTPGTGASCGPNCGATPVASWLPALPPAALAIGGDAFWHRARRQRILSPSA